MLHYRPVHLLDSESGLKLEFLNGCGVHIGAAISTIWSISGVYYEFHVGCKQTLKEPLSVFFN